MMEAVALRKNGSSMFQSLPWITGRTADRELPAVVAPEPQARPRRPAIGLALGGGAARGFAHIGALRVLTEAGYHVDVIAGTSIGAVVGGCYIAGKLDELELWARSLTKRRVLGLLDFSIGGGGLIAGSRLGHLLMRDLGHITIEDLPVPFAAVATEIGPGHEIWLTRGSLVKALRASYALPGIFEPIRIGGRWLMDGALVNPVPVSTARALGARVVIAVNLNGELAGRGAVVPSHGAHADDEELPLERSIRVKAFGAASSLVKRQLGFLPKKEGPRDPRVPGISTVMMDAFNITQDRISRSRLAGDPPDVMVGPRLGRIGLFDFHRAREIIELGAEATARSLDAVREAVEALT
jgi:NTE family protein